MGFCAGGAQPPAKDSAHAVRSIYFGDPDPNQYKPNRYPSVLRVMPDEILRYAACDRSTRAPCALSLQPHHLEAGVDVEYVAGNSAA